MKVTGSQQIADIFNVNQKTITEWTNDGMPVLFKGGRGIASQYETADCIEWRIRRDQVASDGNGYDLTAERARLSHHQANIAALDEDIKRGTLIPADQVKAKWIDIKSSARAKLISLPTKVASSCAGKSEADIESVAREIIYQALDEMARGDAD